jgi:cyclic beta-1,2-glucan synthetase
VAVSPLAWAHEARAARVKETRHLKAIGRTVRDALRDWGARLRRGPPVPQRAENEPPLRAELLSAGQMEQHGRFLAGAHRLSVKPGRDRLLARLAANEAMLVGVCGLLTAAVKANRRIAPAGEWLLDNFYLLEEQVRTAKRHLPKRYSRELPRLAFGPSAERPRVYDIALESVSHGDGRIDLEGLSRFVSAYQKVTALTLGELWAIPIMLRLALIENLRRVAARIAAGTADRDRAGDWADQMMGVAEKDPKSLILTIADMARSGPPMTAPFVSEFARRLQGQSPALALPLTWIEQRLSESSLTIEQLVQEEAQRQAADQVSISNSISSLRFLGAMDWREFVETLSVVDRTLRDDPGGVYGRMDFATRDRYRHVVERIARAGRLSEGEVARKAVELAHEGASGETADDRAAHVGFYLIDKGLPQLERAARERDSAAATLRRVGERHPLLLYLGVIALFTTSLAALLVTKAQADGAGFLALVLAGIASALGASQLAVALANWLASLLVIPRPLPRMDFGAGIPSEYRTLAVVPTMLASAQGIEDLVEALEVRFLANQDASLHFGLLTDWRDAPAERLAEDEPLLLLARARIEELNRKYAHARNDRFFLFHRPRRWNPQERIWMGYERKRGKLSELNAFLRDGARERFALVVGETAVLSNVKYVITLDTDTQLPRDAARQLAGAMAHPLNRPRWDAGRRRVCDGYGILQPRMAVSLPSTNRSRYARLCGSDAGIDPYTRAVSDAYQDLFAEGSFIGKGIYDLDAFERALEGRFPENRILSHDLLEGCYARAGLLSDVLLFEEYPSRYGADVSRRRRWIRGDWQIADWLLPRVPAGGGRRERNPLSMLAQWKLLDNLRRSLVPAALVLLLVLGWIVLQAPAFWTLAVLGIALLPPLMASVVELSRKPDEVPFGQHAGASLRSAGRHVAQSAFALACLPYEAFISLDAIVRTTLRVLFTHRRLLEWRPSSEPDQTFSMDFAGTCAAMSIAPATAVAAAAWIAASDPAALAIAGPILGLWFGSPAIAWWISRPRARREARLSAGQALYLRRLARRTWAFFETFVGAEDHWLPPDNFQEYRGAVVAHRTSPTNMGLALLANLAAYDFRYLSAGVLLERTANALRSMAALERHQGHFFNWYDTQSLQPLPPRYVSSVDSGNLAGHLLTLRQGLLALPDEPILVPRVFEGVSDTLGIFVDVTAEDLAGPLAGLRKDLQSASDSPPAALDDAWRRLERLAGAAADIARRFEAGPAANPDSEEKWWALALDRQCRGSADELLWLAPWLALPPPAGLGEIVPMDGIPTLRRLAGLAAQWLPVIVARLDAAPAPEERARLHEMQRAVAESAERVRKRIAVIGDLARQAGELARMEYDFLYDKGRHLLAIGYNVGERRRDTSYYDLLASEARLSCFVAIAQGQLPQESWFALGRLLTTAGGEPILLSWSGSMFEYLMPLLVMPAFESTLLDQTCRAAVARQIEYGRQRGVPWGMSESGYNAVDVHLNYQYRAFGVPGLGLKRGLSEDLVVAPYASALALMVAPEAACLNLQRLAALGLEGRFGLYEAIDYTRSRQRRGESSTVVRSYMAHHQGMTLLSLAHLLLDRPMQRRFESDPLCQATALLLQERIPKATAFHLRAAELPDVRGVASGPEMPVRVLASPDTPAPEVQLLSNGRYHVMVTNAGGGYSRWKDLAVTRWREDSTCDPWGSFCYIRDPASGEFWSNTHQPTLQPAADYEAMFSEARVEFRRRDRDCDVHTEIVVSPEDDIELRRLRVTNRSRARRAIEITSYAEVVLAAAVADALHPAFSNLFVQTEILASRQAILCTRRPRSIEERPPWMFHLMVVHGTVSDGASYETDRARFVGRGCTLAAPRALREPGALSGSEGSVLDPIVAIRHRITLEPDEAAIVDMVTGIGETRDAALGLIGKYQDRHLADRVFDLAWTHSWVTLRQINATESDAQLYGRLAGSVIYANPALRADAAVVGRNRRGQSSLWGYAISGDLPIVLLQIGDLENIDLVRQLVQAHAYWRLKGLAVDLVIWNEDTAGYRQLLQEQIMGLIAGGIEAHVMDRPGGIFVRRAEQISDEDRVLLQSVARAIITDRRGALGEQIGRRGQSELRAPHLNMPRLNPTRARRAETALPGRELQPGDLILGNGLGGFAADGREYVIATAAGQETPAPWANVLANPHFGSVVSESGPVYTWSENAHEFRLTPWANDPVCESSGEAFYLRDEESGQFWSPTPLPARGATPYVTRHGFGYSVFEHAEDGIRSELWIYVELAAAVKFSVLKLRNDSGRPRRISATGYVEWVLGDLRPKTVLHVVTEVDPASGALFARNAYNTEFADRIAFFDTDGTTRSVSGDRTEFVGRNGSLRNPAAMSRTQLSNKVGAALDPCAAIQVPLDLAPGEEREVIFRLGVAGRRGADEAHKLVRRFRGTAAARSALETVRQYWQRTLGALQIETPDRALDVLANGWLVYQTLACRIWARSGYYQSGGAFGFRDQLQDAMALIHAEPALLREHLLRCAARQFREGDVQHWWHPSSGRGVRTHCSDDFLWLPLAASRYVLATGDRGVLDETVNFIDGRALNPEEDSYYDLPGRSEETATFYRHCVRAIEHALRFGERGLPLIGTGDWNDGMNMVGAQGRGESIWLGFFLFDVLIRFGRLARAHGDEPFADRCEAEADQLRRNLEQHGWDGAWYRRAYFDDGTPLGSAANAECQIDSIAQSWSVLSGAGDARRSRQAMAALDERLVRREHGLIQLLDPPFDQSALNPGYIKGYVPGVRENGGQYTHAAIWAAMAFAALGDSRRAWELAAMINPLSHAASATAVATYKVEPYVIAADVYAVAPHSGRGGWTWYTGSAGWMYRLVVESLLGLQLEGDRLRFVPCLPASWEGFRLRYRYRETVYRIDVRQLPGEGGAMTVAVDGLEQTDQAITLQDDGREHSVEVIVRASRS